MLQIVLDWLAKLLNLPSCFLAYGPDGNLGRGGGVIQVGLLSHLHSILSSPFCALGLPMQTLRVHSQGCHALASYSSHQEHGRGLKR